MGNHQKRPMTRKTKMWMWIVGVPVGLVVVVFVVGSLLPSDYRVRGHVDLALSPAELWKRLTDIEKHPMSANMARNVEVLPQENGLPVWIEDIGSTKIRVRSTVLDEPVHVVRKMEDEIVPMTAHTEFTISPNGDGSRVAVDHAIRIDSGTWHVPVFRVTLTLFSGARRGMEAFFKNVGGSEAAPAFAWQ